MSLNNLTDMLSIIAVVLVGGEVLWMFRHLHENDWTTRYLRVLVLLNLMICVTGFLLRPANSWGIIDQETRDYVALVLRVSVISTIVLSWVVITWRWFRMR